MEPTWPKKEEPYYSQLIRAHPRISADEMVRLVRLAQSGCIEAERRAVEANYRLVAAMLHKYFRGYLLYPHNQLSADDLFTEAVTGLQRAIRTYDPDKGKFSTYATQWIFQKVQRAIDDTGHTIRFPGWVWENLRKEWRQGGGGGNFYEDVRADGLVSADTSLEMTVTNHKATDQMTLGDSISDPHTDGVFHSLGLERDLETALQCLDEREREIICRSFGLGGHDPQVNRTIGAKMEVSHERVRQIKSSALAKLRKHAPDLSAYVES